MANATNSSSIDPCISKGAGSVGKGCVGAEYAERLTRCRVDGDGIAPHAGSYIKDAVGHHGRRLPVVVWSRTEVIRLPAPDNLGLGYVISVDLVQRRTLGGARPAAVETPFAVLRALLRRQGRSNEDEGDLNGTFRRNMYHLDLLNLAASLRGNQFGRIRRISSPGAANRFRHRTDRCRFRSPLQRHRLSRIIR